MRAKLPLSVTLSSMPFTRISQEFRKPDRDVSRGPKCAAPPGGATVHRVSTCATVWRVNPDGGNPMAKPVAVGGPLRFR
jgi:hypothetical protein